MYDPRIKLTHNILNDIVKFEIEKKGIDDLALDDDITMKMRLGANSSDIFHLANLFGVNITVKVARKIAAGKTTSIGDERGQYLTNFRNAMEYILATQTAYFPVQGNVLVHLNKILIKGIAEDWDAKYRISGEDVNTKDDSWVEFRDVKIAPAQVQSLALEPLDWFTGGGSKIHPLIRIPAIIYRLIRIAPFVMGNKLTILAVLKYLFFKSEMLLGGMLPVIKNFDVYQKDYTESWKQAIAEGEDITLWVERFIKNYAGSIVEIREKLNKTIEEHKEKNKQPFLNLNRRQLKILRYLQNIPKVKREEYVEMMDVSTMTAYRDLNELVSKGMLKVEGRGRGTVYMLTSR